MPSARQPRLDSRIPARPIANAQTNPWQSTGILVPARVARFPAACVPRVVSCRGWKRASAVGGADWAGSYPDCNAFTTRFLDARLTLPLAMTFVQNAKVGAAPPRVQAEPISCSSRGRRRAQSASSVRVATSCWHTRELIVGLAAGKLMRHGQSFLIYPAAFYPEMRTGASQTRSQRPRLTSSQRSCRPSSSSSRTRSCSCAVVTA